MRITQQKCDLMYDCLDELEAPEYIPYKHNVLELERFLKENPSEKEAFIAYLIYVSEYGKNEEEKRKYISKYLYKNLKVVG